MALQVHHLHRRHKLEVGVEREEAGAAGTDVVGVEQRTVRKSREVRPGKVMAGWWVVTFAVM